jgi:hypothetical protein
MAENDSFTQIVMRSVPLIAVFVVNNAFFDVFAVRWPKIRVIFRLR